MLSILEITRNHLQFFVVINSRIVKEVIRLNYKKYQDIRDLSWNILIREKVSELPVNIVTLCKQMDIQVKYYTPDDSDGKSLFTFGYPIILVNKECSRPRKRFTIAHELGHILLGHVGKYGLVNREPSPNDNPIEQEANIFASRLLAPACVLWGCQVCNVEELAKLCGISKKAAIYRMERLRILYARNAFLRSPLEKQVYKQFKSFIANHQHLVNP